jgi:hypothetical protein
MIGLLTAIKELIIKPHPNCLLNLFCLISTSEEVLGQKCPLRNI